MEPSYSSSDKHLKAELLGASCNLKTFSLELQWSESPGVFYRNSSILFSSNTKSLWALLYEFLEGGECTIDFNTKMWKEKQQNQKREFVTAAHRELRAKKASRNTENNEH